MIQRKRDYLPLNFTRRAIALFIGKGRKIASRERTKSIFPLGLKPQGIPTASFWTVGIYIAQTAPSYLGLPLRLFSILLGFIGLVFECILGHKYVAKF